jgi:hypothetical protein
LLVLVSFTLRTAIWRDSGEAQLVQLAAKTDKVIGLITSVGGMRIASRQHDGVCRACPLRSSFGDADCTSVEGVRWKQVFARGSR